ncbi:XPC-binding domain and Ubiquitin-associated/translation elongation factor EF1B, N-terminal, eukaryote domain-containing protein [Strongyloides ratti]|uniref:XPC-binding domain and Ubiquitin-associated/translation elongation factor EF1B, N-terminal, eukaryote domain-containing protein n=1 Tax=Strongyloides ratti TaxID=34506 RepID=A0A090L7G6_STRRB|nr:XPC-binding domain and Ubiquitin-associated/translation elongation factor EF1B, N-terminal, eukaryote domain-containing protein [Strongyloides ratti]CEF63469.1 XPC-binding domain and Ubiquitin-associated/translation elongation factor EF1B, N-terminal, eukaryote domain-containing protein [Strongyloides ratti]
MTEVVFQTINRRKKKLFLDGPTEVNSIKQQLMDLFDPISEGEINGKFDKVDHGLIYAGKLYDDKDIVGVEKNDETDDEDNVQEEDDGHNSESDGESMDITDPNYNVDGIQDFYHEVLDEDVHMEDAEHHGEIVREIFAYSSSTGSHSDEDMAALSENDIDIGDGVITTADEDDEDNESSDEETAVDGESDQLTNSGLDSLSLSELNETEEDGSEETGSDNEDLRSVEIPENYPEEKDPTNSTMAQTIRSTIGLGFTSTEVKACLEYSKHDTEYALNILLVGFDDLKEADWWGVAPSAECNPSKIDSLLSAESFQDLRLLFQRQPSFLKSYLKRIQKIRPEFIETVKKYEDIFINLISVPTRLPPSVDDDMFDEMDGVPLSSMVMNTFTRHGNNDIHAIQNIIDVLNSPETHYNDANATISEADEVVIERLMEFTRKPRDVVKVAYLRADKNELLAANVLLGIDPF